MSFEEWEKTIDIAVKTHVNGDHTVIIGCDDEIIEKRAYWGNLLSAVNQAKRHVYNKLYADKD